MDAANGAVTPGEKRSRLRRLYSSARTRRNGASRGKTERARESYRWLHRENTCETQEAALKEYEALRAEISASMQAQISLLAFGSTALGLVFAGASASADARARDILFLILAPLLCYLIVTIWFAEVSRTMRAGAFLMQLERRLDRDFRIGAMTWESALFHRRMTSGPRSVLEDPDRLRNAAVTVLFLGIAGASIAVGWDAAPGWSWQRITAIGGLTGCVAVLLRIRALRERQQHELLFRPARIGDVGPHVSDLQRALQKVQLYEGALDGRFDEKTRAAVEAFQAKADLPKDGVAGAVTWSYVEAELPDDPGVIERLR